MISSMASVEIAGPLKLLDRTLEAVQEAGVLHIEEIPLLEDPKRGSLHRIRLSEAQAREKQVYEEVLRLLEEAVARIPPSLAQRLRGSPQLAEEYRRWAGESDGVLASTARILHAKVRSLVRRERNLADDLQALSAYEEVTVALVPLVEAHELPAELEFIGVVFDRQSRVAGELLEKEIDALTGGRYRYYQSGLSGQRAAALLGFARDRDAEVRDFLTRAGISPMAFPRYLRGKPFEQALAALEADLAQLHGRQKALAAQAGRFYEESGLRLLAMRNVCKDLLSRYETFGKFARTRYAFLMRGWLEAREQDRLADLLRREAGPTVLVRRIRPKGMGLPPVLLANPRPVRSFEPLLSLLPLPQYGSVDPTKFVATFFPPMFGLMLGDMGYGAILGAVALLIYLLARRKPASPSRRLMGRLGIVLGACAFFTIVFGAAFGELFGTLGHQLGLHPLWRERFPLGSGELGGAILTYLGLAIGIGALQILLGLVLGLINAWRFRDSSMALGNMARIAGILALGFLVGRLAGLLPSVFSYLGLGLVAAFLAIMVLQTVRHPSHGLMLPLEVLSTVGNILSYARIMAIGMASVVLALLATILARLFASPVLAAAVVVLVHMLNLVLGTIDPTIQGLRLHYVEFFSKFLLTGGKRFSPFKKLGGEIA
jgi:V/A-type H+-transporting ATPase subunit I